MADRTLNLAIGTDAIDSTVAVTAGNLRELGTVSALTQAGVSAFLTTSDFVANGAATFTFGTGTPSASKVDASPCRPRSNRGA